MAAEWKIETKSTQTGKPGSLTFAVIARDCSNEEDILAEFTCEVSLSARKKFGDAFLQKDAEESAVEWMHSLFARMKNKGSR